MNLEQTIESVAQSLKRSQFPNEQAVSQGVVLRILRDLGWDTYNPDHVWPEYAVSGKRVDFALCTPPKTPAVFVEVKQPGRGEGADQQLFEYAFHTGVPMAILTDGQTWGFYLPAERGSYEDRRVYKLDLVERTPAEAAAELRRYLDYSRTMKGEAIAEAQKNYRDTHRRRTAQRTILEAWRDLVRNEDPELIERIAVEVETKCGVRPEVDDVVAFLGKQAADAPSATSTARQPPKPTSSVSPAPAAGGRCGFTLRGTFTPCRNGKEVMVELLRALAQRDPSFPEKCHSHPDNTQRRRTYIAQSPSRIYMNRPDLEHHTVEFAPGWFVATNVSNDVKNTILKIAFDVSGLAMGTDVLYTL